MDNNREKDKLPDRLRKILSQRVDRATKASEITGAILQLGRYRWVGVYDVNHERGLVSNVAWSGVGAPAYPTFSVTKGLTSRAITSRKTVNVGDVAGDSDYLTALDTTRSEIIVPILDKHEDRVIGTIDVESEHPHSFDPSTQALLEDCATLLAEFWPLRDETTSSG